MTDLRRVAIGTQGARAPADIRHINNLDLIRLLASAQVAIVHTGQTLDVLNADTLMWLGIFPGVPIFFFVSGFLISQSLERTATFDTYLRNRILRIFPALWACFFLSVGMVAAFQPLPWASMDFLAWVAGQVTFVQFFNPDFLRHFGLGVLNGSLWTIPVELQFYIVLPVLYLLVRRLGEWAFWVALVAALIGHALFLGVLYGNETLVAKLAQVSFVPWLGLFLAGAGANRLWPKIDVLFRGQAIVWLAIYLALAVPAVATFGNHITGNRLPGPLCIALFCLVLSCGYTRPNLARSVLKGTDISYGLYLFHGPIINAYVEATERGWIQIPSLAGAFLVLLLAAIMAITSWHMIEQPALTLKKIRPSRLVVDQHEGHL